MESRCQHLLFFLNQTAYEKNYYCLFSFFVFI